MRHSTHMGWPRLFISNMAQPPAMALTAGLQKVRAQLKVSKPAPQPVLNDQ